MAQTFQSLYFLFKACCIKINADDSNIRKLPDGDAISQFLNDVIQEQNETSAGFSLEMVYLVEQPKIHNNLHDVSTAAIEEEDEFIGWMMKELRTIGELLEQRRAFEGFGEKEAIVHFVRTTILHDRWFETESGKRQRSYVIRKYFDKLWQIEMGYHLLNRYEAIMIQPREDDEYKYPAFVSLGYFNTGDSFPVAFSENPQLNVPIAYWEPDRLYMALRMISRVRNMPVLIHTTKELDDIHKANNTKPVHEKGIFFASSRYISVFREYLSAIFDRIAQLCYYPCEVDLDKFNTEFPLWFKRIEQDVEVDDIREAVGIAGGRIDILKNVRNHREKEDEKVRQNSGYENRKVKPVSRAEIIQRLRTAIDKELNSTEGMRRDIIFMENNLAELEKTATMDGIDADIAREDADSARELRRRIKAKKEMIRLKEEVDRRANMAREYRETASVLKMIENVTGEKMDIDEKLVKIAEKQAESEEIKQDASGRAIKMLIPARPWFYMNMCITDYMKQMQIEVGGGIAPQGFEKIKAVFMKECTDMIDRIDNASIVRAKQWIMKHGLTPWEREVYRMDLEGETEIDLYQAWQSLYRTTITRDPGDEENDNESANEELPNFPKTFSELFTGNTKYLMLGRAYVGWLYFYQTFNAEKSQHDRWFYFWDYEQEIAVGNHVNLLTPVMSKFGCEWVVIEPCDWTVAPPEIVSCGFDFCDCVAVFLAQLNARNWLVHMRDTDEMVDFKNSEIYNIYVEGMKQQEIMEQAHRLE